jgi:phytoene dehydrogenase-like protein
MSKKVIIIGGGIAGLSAGCYAAANGFDTEIHEMHTLAGGLCTGWKRKGYMFDGCIHWLVGTSPEDPFNKLWVETGALKDREVINHEIFAVYRGDEGKELKVYTDADKLEKHMIQLSPADKDTVRLLTESVKSLRGFFMPVDKPHELYSLGDTFKLFKSMKPFLKIYKKLKKLTIADYAAKFEDPFLREAVASVFGYPELPLIGFILTLSWLDKSSAGWPVGGSYELAQAMEDQFKALGGRVFYNSKVEKILTSSNTACGVQLESGREVKADYVVSAADSYSTIYSMLGGQYLNREIKQRFEKLKLFPSYAQISFGIKKDLSAFDQFILQKLEDPVQIGSKLRKAVPVKHFCYDSSMAPEGCSVVIAGFDEDYDYWEGLEYESDEYHAEKKSYYDKVLPVLKEVYGDDIEDYIDVYDVTTPHSLVRYTGNYRGSMEGWLMTTDTMRLYMKKTLPGLKNFYMAGQWVEPGGGLPPALYSGRGSVMLICRDEGVEFKSIE